MKTEIGVVLVENLDSPHRMYRWVLEQIPDVKLLGSFYYAEDLLQEIRQGLRPDVIVMDIRMDERPDGMPHIDGITAAIEVRRQFPQMPIVLYSFWPQTHNLERFKEAQFGSRIALLKRGSMFRDTLAEVIRRVVRGERYIDEEFQIALDLMAIQRRNSPLALLETEAQREVLRLLADGLNNGQIAEARHQQKRWVEERIGEIYSLLNLSGEDNTGTVRVRAARMYWEDRILVWKCLGGDTLCLMTPDRYDELKPLSVVKSEEAALLEDAALINNMAG